MKRKFLFLYLNTGSGHINAAKVLKAALEEKYPDCSVEMVHGFGTQRTIGKFLFEKVYAFACNYLHGLFPIIYDTAQLRFVQSIYVYFLKIGIPRRLRHLILENKITDVVSFHFALTPPLVRTVPFIPWKVNVTGIVTDPFNGPHSWYYERKEHFLVYSQQMKDAAIKESKMNPGNLKIIPFLMNPKFREPATEQQIRELRIKHGFNPDKKLVLLTGGGEGLPGALKIINQCVIHKADFSIAVVCGRDVAKKTMLEVIAKANPKLDLHVFGFVNFMDELVKICDCAVIKAGPAMLMEVLACHKPVIICRYIHNQELENVRFAVRNHIGWFIQSSRKIYHKINEILSDENFSENMKSHFDRLEIDTDAKKAAQILYENEWPAKN